MERKYTTAQIGKDEAVKLKEMSKKSEITQTEFLTTAITYLHKTGVNPLNLRELNVNQELSIMNKRINSGIGFIRTFEKDKLSPFIAEFELLQKTIQEQLQQQAEVKPKTETPKKKTRSEAMVKLESIESKVLVMIEALKAYLDSTDEVEEQMSKQINDLKTHIVSCLRDKSYLKNYKEQ